MDSWACPVCLSQWVVYTEVKALAAHVEVAHPEWLEGSRTPPPQAPRAP